MPSRLDWVSYALLVLWLSSINALRLAQSLSYTPAPRLILILCSMAVSTLLLQQKLPMCAVKWKTVGSIPIPTIRNGSEEVPAPYHSYISSVKTAGTSAIRVS
eukprot:COSAG06_NODE_26402_length_615_cov_3.779070_1_plen_103_part_00